jgi:hypothetical protein
VHRDLRCTKARVRTVGLLRNTEGVIVGLKSLEGLNVGLMYRVSLRSTRVSRVQYSRPEVNKGLRPLQRA